MEMKALSLGALILATSLANAQGPMAGGYGGGGVDKATFSKLTKAQASADLAFKKNPKNAAVRKAYIDANNRHGLAAMRTDAVDRKLKYRMALADFRKVLRVDPKNAVAKQNSDLIISIYKSMGRPVPGA